MTTDQKPTPEQQRRLTEFDETERILQKQLKALLERRREYINTNQLNKRVDATAGRIHE